jgi:hypothetical protein
LGCLPAWALSCCSCVCLLETVGAGDHDLELAAVVTIVGCGCRVGTGAPECALVVRDRGGLGTVYRVIERRIPFHEDVKASAEGSIVAILGAPFDVVGVESL